MTWSDDAAKAKCEATYERGFRIMQQMFASAAKHREDIRSLQDEPVLFAYLIAGALAACDSPELRMVNFRSFMSLVGPTVPTVEFEATIRAILSQHGVSL